MSEHKIVESVGKSWDQAGYRPPWNWHVTCSCGWRVDGLRGQLAVFDAWHTHVAEQRP